MGFLCFWYVFTFPNIQLFLDIHIFFGETLTFTNFANSTSFLQKFLQIIYFYKKIIILYCVAVFIFYTFFKTNSKTKYFLVFHIFYFH